MQEAAHLIVLNAIAGIHGSPEMGLERRELSLLPTNFPSLERNRYVVLVKLEN